MSGVYKLSILQRCDQDSERTRGRRRGKIEGERLKGGKDGERDGGKREIKH